MAADKQCVNFFGIQKDKTAKNYGLSNFSDLPVTIPHDYDFFPWAVEDLTFPNSEAAFQAFKCPNDEKSVRQFITQSSPKEAKELGRRIQLREDWEDVKVKWMTIVIWFKFKDVPELLTKTGNAQLIETSPFDYFWGCGRSKKGKNMLGKILMFIRDKLVRNEELSVIDFEPLFA